MRLFHCRDARELRYTLKWNAPAWADEDQVWRGDDGSSICAAPGDFEAEADEDASETYVLVGTVAQFREDMRIVS